MSIQTITQDGRERIVMDRADYEELLDARDHAVAMHEIAAGAAPLSSTEMEAYLGAPSPLAFFRRRSGKTQAVLAEDAGISQAFLAQIETGKRAGGVRVLLRLARSLGVRVEDLVVD